jgi:beta-glucanase (GH16 family)
MQKKFPFLSLCLCLALTGCPADDENDGMSAGELPTLQVTDATVVEGNQGSQIVSIVVTTSTPAATGSSFRFGTENGTATAGEDFVVADGGTIAMSASGSLTLAFKILGDLNREEDETFKVVFSEGMGLIADGVSATITITNDDDQDNPYSIPEEGPDSPTSYDGYTLTWADEFDDASSMTTNYVHELGSLYNGWGNNELQFYQRENTIIGDGHMIIEARRESTGGLNYTSSRVITKGRRTFTTGRIDVRAAMPEGQGIWPAIWMLGTNIDEVGWPACGEIDIMEMLGHETNTLHGTVHFANASGSHQFTGNDVNVPDGLNGRFNVFTVIWTSAYLEWRLNNVTYHRVERSALGSSAAILDQPQYLLFNVAVGGNWPGNPDATTTFPQRMYVDYVRVFQED